PGGGGGQTRHDLRYNIADHTRQTERVRDVGRHGVHAHAELAALHRAEADELIHDAARHVHGDGEADADIAAAAREDRGIDPDQLAVQVDERAAGIARIDGSVGLDEVVVAVGVDSRARQTA